MAYDLEAIRRKLRESGSGRFVDPDEFKPDQAKSAQEALKWRFYILPPLRLGETVKGGGKASKSMDQFFIQHANHWINSKPYPCPRVYDNSKCQLCAHGFALLDEEEDKDKRRAIVDRFMPNSSYLVNIYFPPISSNPEDLRGKVKFYNGTKTSFDHWSACINRDNSGDEHDPQAFGAFFDESAAFPYQLEALKNGKNNSYKTSKFLALNGRPVPLVVDSEGRADKAAIKAILDSRIDLFTKFQAPKADEIARLAAHLLDGDDFDASTTSEKSGSGSGFDMDESEHKERIPAKEKPAEKLVEKAEKPAEKPSKPQVADTVAGEVPFDLPQEATVNKAEIEALLSRLDP